MNALGDWQEELGASQEAPKAPECDPCVRLLAIPIVHTRIRVYTINTTQYTTHTER